MMHHLPDDLKQRGLAEVARVLKPNGRLIVVDFNRTQERRSGPLSAGNLELRDLPALMKEIGLYRMQGGEMPFPPLVEFQVI